MTLLEGRRCLLENEGLNERGVYEIFSKMRSTFIGQERLKSLEKTRLFQ